MISNTPVKFRSVLGHDFGPVENGMEFYMSFSLFHMIFVYPSNASIKKSISTCILKIYKPMNM